MNDNYIKCGHYYMNGKKYQIVADQNFKKDYLQEIEENGEIIYKDISEEERKILDSIFNPPSDGFLGLISKDGENEIEISDNVPKEYISVIHYFIKIVREQFPTINFTNFYRNLKTLKVCAIKPGENLGLAKTSFRYNYKDNTIYVKLNRDGTLKLDSHFMHELFHVLTADTNVENPRVGFMDIKRRKAGTGVNEFVTQYLTCNLFNGRKGYFDDFDYEIINKITKIINYDIFMDCFFNTDLEILIISLMCYLDNQTVKRLILLMDNYFYLSLKVIENEQERLDTITKEGKMKEEKLKENINCLLDRINGNKNKKVAKRNPVSGENYMETKSNESSLASEREKNELQLKAYKFEIMFIIKEAEKRKQAYDDELNDEFGNKIDQFGIGK